MVIRERSVVTPNQDRYRRFFPQSSQTMRRRFAAVEIKSSSRIEDKENSYFMNSFPTTARIVRNAMAAKRGFTPPK